MNPRVRLRPVLLMLTALMTAATIAAPASAHGIVVWAERDGDVVRVEAHLTDGAHATNAPIEIVDQDGLTVAEGRTDQDGRFRFDDPTRGAVTIRVRLDQEHVGVFRLDEAE